jgi:5' nucleotidase, deoxy (Pyrimidine), cytosolic type C protein (NT5C)
MKLYFDMDGVLADFDSAARDALDMDPHKFEFVYGADLMWQILDAVPDFFYNMEPMPGALALWQACEHLKPGIITALPRTGALIVEQQKREWVLDVLDTDAEVITCLTKEKPNYCFPGDILIDDRAINRSAWEAKGGIYILHKDAVTTWADLVTMGVI